MGTRRACALIACLAGPAFAQGTSLDLGDGFTHDSSLPVEIAADSLSLNQTAGTATFEGAVTVGQGDLRMQADRLDVFYAQAEGQPGDIERIEAAGAVTLTNGTETAEADAATYDVVSGEVQMTGNVLLTQGGNALSGQQLDIDLGNGLATMQGRVTTILQPGSGQ